MKRVLLIVGIVVLSVGLIGALYGSVTAAGLQAEYDFLCPTGQMPPQFCSLLLSTASTYRAFAIGMGLLAIAGLAVTLAAALMKGPLVPPTPAAPPLFPPPVPPAGAATSRNCVQCGRTNLGTDRFCSNCGAALG